MAKTMCTILGALFLLAGLAGFAAPHLMGFHLSPAHNIIHLVSGGIALYLGLAGTMAAARLFCFAFGCVYLLLGVVGFAAGAYETRHLIVIPGVLELGMMDHILHLVLGCAFLVAGFMTAGVYDEDEVVRPAWWKIRTQP